MSSFLIEIISRIPNYKKKDYVHIAKLPDMFRGKYKYDDEEAGFKYAQEVWWPGLLMGTMLKCSWEGPYPPWNQSGFKGQLVFRRNVQI